jgi:hypothetical protein
MREAQFSSKAYGTHEYKEITIEGRVQFDLLMALQVGGGWAGRAGRGLWAVKAGGVGARSGASASSRCSDGFAVERVG